MDAYKVSMNTGYHYGVDKEAAAVGRAFRKIDLEQFVGKAVVVTREDGNTQEGVIGRHYIEL